MDSLSVPTKPSSISRKPDVEIGCNQLTARRPTTSIVPLAIPDVVRSAHQDWNIALAWSHIAPLATWRLSRGSEVRFVKLALKGWEPALEEEFKRIRWASDHLVVPAVHDMGTTADMEWMVTDGLPGRSVAELSNGDDDPATVIRMFALALRRLHESPADGCPFDDRLDVALERARSRLARNAVNPADFNEAFHDLSAGEAIARLEAERPPAEDVVLCHGDYCCPNLLIDHGVVSGYLDLGGLGLADRWSDVAVGAWSVTWNFGEGWEKVFLDAYGIERDDARMWYYRLLYEVAGGTFIPQG